VGYVRDICLNNSALTPAIAKGTPPLTDSSLDIAIGQGSGVQSIANILKIQRVQHVNMSQA
jgi:hypothetical protein